MPIYCPARLSLARGGPAWTPGALAVAEPDGPAPPVAFRAVLHLRFSCGGADEIAIEAAATALRGRFLPRERNARTAAPGESAAALAATANGVRVELATPRRLETVRLKGAANPAAGSKLRVHRVDGEAVADKPTATASNRGLGAPVLDRVVVSSFAFAAPGAGQALVAGAGIGVSDSRLFALPGDPPFDADRFALFLDDPLGHPVGIAPNDLDTVGIRTFPTGPRIGLAGLPAPDAPETPEAGDPLDAPNFFFRADGLVGGGEVPLEAGQFDAGADLAKALQNALARIEAPLPGAIDVALIFASDAPCSLAIDALSAGYRLIRSSWPVAAEPAPPDRGKRSVRLGPGAAPGASGAPLAIELPAGAQLESARIEGTLRLGNHRPPAAGLDPLALASSVGVEITEGTAALQRIDPAVGQVTAVALPLLPFGKDTALRLEILDDSDGELGRVAASSELALESAGLRRWAVLPLARPVALAATSWLRLTSTRGALLWLSHPASGSIRRAEASSPKGLPLELPSISGHQAIYQFLTSAVDSENPTGPVILRLGDARIPNSFPNEDGARFDCTAALSAVLAARPPGSPLSIPFDFASDFSGQLKLTPPRLEYALG